MHGRLILKQFTPAAGIVASVAAILVLVIAASALSVADAGNAAVDGGSRAMVGAATGDADLETQGPWWPATYYPAIPTSIPTAAPTVKPTPKPTPKPYRDTVTNARLYVRSRIGTTQYNCIDYIFARESKWNPRAVNPRTGAYGIPQAYPASKLAAFGSNWRYSPLTQVKWGIWYVNSRYGSACQAKAFMASHGWY
jgi:hypothetical protein